MTVGPRVDLHPGREAHPQGDALFLVHPAIGRAGRGADSPDRAGGPVSLRNLSGDAEILRALLVIMSAHVFLEREGAPFPLGSAGWALDPGHLPVWISPARGILEAEDPLRRTLEALYVAAGGRPVSPARPGCRLPRHLRLGPSLGTWFSESLSRSTPGASPEDLMLELWDMARGVGIRPGLPPAFGLGTSWEACAVPASPGLVCWKDGGPLGRRALFQFLSGAGPIPRPWISVDLREASPYPLAALELVAGAALGPGEDSRAWMRSRVARATQDPAPLAAELGSRMALLGAGGWILWPASRLDPFSIQILGMVAEALAEPVALLGDDGEASPVHLRRVHPLWLPPAAASWYLEHLTALLGPSPESWLSSLALLATDEPRAGAPLLPPAPPGLRVPARAFLGNGEPPGQAQTDPARAGGEGGNRPMHELADRGRIPELWIRASTEEDPEAALFWKGVSFLHVGQADLALEHWEGLRESPGFRERLPLYRARALERKGDLAGALREVRNLKAERLPAWDRPRADLVRGHLYALAGNSGEAMGLLDELARSAPDPDLRSQALCHLSAHLLQRGQTEEGLGALAGAESGAELSLEPLSLFLLRHREGMAFKRMGEYGRALESFERSVKLAAGAGFRRLEAAALCDCGNVLRMLSRFAEADGAYTRCYEGARALGLDDLARSARFDRAICQLERGDLARVLPIFQAAVGEDRGSGNRTFAAIDAYWLGTALYHQGAFPEALEWAEKGLAQLEGIPDPEVRFPLLLLRGDILLRSGQEQKLMHLLETLESLLGERTEADDMIHYCALRLESGQGKRFTLRALRETGRRYLPQASAYGRCLWLLAEGASNPEGDGAPLFKALEEARVLANPHLVCRCLSAMRDRRIFPELPPAERQRLARYLADNRIGGDLRSLLPILRPADPAESAPADHSRLPRDIQVLAGASGRSAESLAALLERTSSACAVLCEPGHPPTWWGEAPPESRRALLEACGGEGDLPVSGGRAFGARGRGGIWCGFLHGGTQPGWTPEEQLLLRLWSQLLTPARPSPAAGRPPGVHPSVAGLVFTQSPAMGAVLESLSRAALFRYPVLLTGEPGVGKEICARALHAAWGPGKPMVAANCANLTPTLATSLLFGHRRGSFTGADRDQAGLVEAARGGILFLDEIGELPPETQAQVLRFLQDGTFLPLGETRPRLSDARTVAATNRDLERAVESGTFRADLFHRLNVIRIEIPPLRERPEDIPPLFRRFLEEAAREQGTRLPEVGEDVLPRLASYRWPGNVRELQNLARSLLVASLGEPLLQEAHLPPGLRCPRGGPCAEGLASRMAAAERAILLAELRGSDGNITRCARALGITRQALAQKIRRHGLAETVRAFSKSP